MSCPLLFVMRISLTAGQRILTPNNRVRLPDASLAKIKGLHKQKLEIPVQFWGMLTRESLRWSISWQPHALWAKRDAGGRHACQEFILLWPSVRAAFIVYGVDR